MTMVFIEHREAFYNMVCRSLRMKIVNRRGIVMEVKMTKDMSWKTFDKNILKPYEKKGDDAGMFFAYANVFTYTQIRRIAVEAFKAGWQSAQKALLEKCEVYNGIYVVPGDVVREIRGGK